MDSWFFFLEADGIDDRDYDYPEFRTGQTAEFAVEFSMRDWEHLRVPVVARRVKAKPYKPYEESRYKVVAKLVAEFVGAVDQRLWMIDCGILAFGRLPEGVVRGSLIAGQAYLKVDPWAITNWETPPLPGLVNRWHVLRILRGL